jgi:regulatory protein YycI of two-component signal transduction system YycFG
MLFCFILLSLCVFLVLQVCGRKGVISRNSDLKSKKEEKMESEEVIVRRRSAIDRSAIERTKGDRTHL